MVPTKPKHPPVMEPSLTSEAETLSQAAASTGASSPILLNNLLHYTSQVLLAL